MSAENGYFDEPDSDTVWDKSMNYEWDCFDDYQQDEWYDSWEDEDWDYTPDPLHEWRYPELRPSLYAIFDWWGVQYLPVWIYGVARGFWFDSVVSHFRRDDIGDIPF